MNYFCTFTYANEYLQECINILMRTWDLGHGKCSNLIFYYSNRQVFGCGIRWQLCGYLQRDEQQEGWCVQRIHELHHPSGLGQERWERYKTKRLYFKEKMSQGTFALTEFWQQQSDQKSFIFTKNRGFQAMSDRNREPKCLVMKD